MTCPHQVAHNRSLIRHAYEDYTLGTPRQTNLAIIVRLNALNALAQNAVMMGFAPEGLCRDDFVSPYNSEGPHLAHRPMLPASCPDVLKPTALQRTVRHHPWLDLLPFPPLRDNMLRALDAGTFDDDELCMDLLEVKSGDLSASPALIVWGKPWDFRGWEASVSFLKKWGWLVRDCPEIIEGTNYWREKRGEEKIGFAVS